MLLSGIHVKPYTKHESSNAIHVDICFRQHASYLSSFKKEIVWPFDQQVQSSLLAEKLADAQAEPQTGHR